MTAPAAPTAAPAASRPPSSIGQRLVLVSCLVTFALPLRAPRAVAIASGMMAAAVARLALRTFGPAEFFTDLRADSYRGPMRLAVPLAPWLAASRRWLKLSMSSSRICRRCVFA
jgi:hypothetical protein